MGDFITVLDRLNFTPINTLLLVGLFAFVRSIIKRIELLEAASIRHGTSIAIIKARLDIEEDDD